MEQNGYEQEIDLKELMVAVLRKWRMVIGVAVVAAVLLGGIKAAKSFVQLNDEAYLALQQEKYEKSMEAYEASKAGLEQEVKSLSDSLEKQNAYIENSILISLNPYNEYKSMADFYVNANYQVVPGMVYQSADYTDSMIKSYAALADSSEILDIISEKYPNDTVTYLQELILITPDYDNDMIQISVVGRDSKMASDIRTLLVDYIQQMHDTVTAAIGEHTLNLVNVSDTIDVDLELAARQDELGTLVNELNTRLLEKNKALNELAEPAPMQLSKMSILKSVVKYTALGGFVGAFLVIICVCVSFLLSDKIFNGEEIHKRYGLRCLGNFNSDKKYTKGSPVDGWIDKIAGIDRSISENSVYEMIAANVGNYMGDAKKLLITGSVDMEDLNGVKSRLEEMSFGRTVELIVGEAMGKSASTLRKVAVCDGIILVESAQKGTFKALESELSVVGSMGKNVIGYIMK